MKKTYLSGFQKDSKDVEILTFRELLGLRHSEKLTFSSDFEGHVVFKVSEYRINKLINHLRGQDPVKQYYVAVKTLTEGEYEIYRQDLRHQLQIVEIKDFMDEILEGYYERQNKNK